MKRLFKFLVCFAVLLTLVIVTPLTAGASDEPYGNEGFYVTGYDVNAVIAENNVYDVTETINVHFTQLKHGIVRDIPINREETRENPDGTYSQTKVSSGVWDVSVKGYSFSTDSDSDTYYIQIGDSNKLISGDQTYVISYKIGFGNDGSKDWDEAYYNLIGTDWPCSIDNITFSVTLPKTFDSKNLGFSTGYEGSTGYNPEGLTFSVSGNTITGKMTQRLDEYQGLTMRLELPQGYFKVPDVRLPDWIIMGLMGLLVIASLILFLLFGLDKKPVQTVEFYAPDGLTPSEVGYIIDGSVDDCDVVSLIVYWADKGYLSITDNGGNKYTLKKLKEMDKDAKNFESHMFDGLFKKGDTVTTDDLHYTFSSTYNSTKSMIEASFATDDRRIFTKRSIKLMPVLSFFTAIPFIMSIGLSLSRLDAGIIFAVVMGIMVGVALLFPSFMLIGLLRRWRGEPKRFGKLIGRLIFWAVLTAIAVGVSAINAYEPLLPWTALAATVIIGLCAVFIRKWTPKGVEWLGKIFGLQHFITVAEKDRINMLVQQNPSYFYNILPYAYVLGITDKWVKNFESITVAPPTWYYGQGMFTPYLFMGSMHSAMNSFRTQMTSVRPSSSGGSGGFGGGGFSGGGFSGGGGGGGGGHSW